MIKINLLPARVIEVRRVRNLAKLLILVVLVEVIVLSAGVYSLAKQEQAWETKYDRAHERAEEVRTLEGQVAAAQRAASPLKAKVDWYESIYKHHEKIGEALEKINEYIFAKLTVRQLKLSGSTVRLNAATKDIDHVAKAYFNLLRSSNVVPGTVQMNIGKGSGGGGGGGSRG
ncbi:MAG: hypothetical protein GTO55_05500, partial [Armatimonadetes bacterium]|nr:hypothetical protein [Armatimonadota bacterium]NIM23713.1 hypothetical protein [Armatimonadota bacterium]NIM67590.1 hypothetical protein [Armatimonadota bacterium]NIM76113.1 hypothetical protein [Armatimonadota bacterium]NIN05796.1 hypothetical protein [Armatimonadota bacterium]